MPTSENGGAAKNEQIEMQPFQWSKPNQQWHIDSSAFPNSFRQTGSDRWIIPLPNGSLNNQEKTNYQQPNKKKEKLTIPSGWLIIDKDFLQERKIEIDEEDAIKFFDGRLPRWKYALSSKIPRREVVSELLDKINSSRENNRMKVHLVVGAGGEGKSTVLQQVVCDLVTLSSEWNVLWNNDSKTPLRDFVLTRLPQSSANWLIVSDDADLIAGNIFNAIKHICHSDRKDIQFLLCCRDTDWIEVANKYAWEEYVAFEKIPLRGLSEEDAKLIVRAWSEYGDRGTGRLSGLEHHEASRRLFEAAKLESSRAEGAFLGAMLRVRIGEDLKQHIKFLLDRLQDKPIPKNKQNKKLMEAFA